MRPLLGLALLAALLAGCAQPDAGEDDAAGGGEPAPEPQAIEVVVGRGGVGAPPTLYTLSPARLELVAGTPYSLTLRNADALGGHDLLLEGLDVHIETIGAGTTSEPVVFTPAEPGTYAMYCTLGGSSPTSHRAQGMRGEVVVT